MGRWSLPQVRFDHARIVAYVERRSLGDPLPVVEHGHPFRHVHHDLHVVLDEQDRQVEVLAQRAHEVGQRGRLLGVHPRRRLVEQKQFRLARQRAGDLHPPLIPVGQPGRDLIKGAVADAHVLEELRRLGPRLALFLARPRRANDRADETRVQPGVASNEHVLERGHRSEQADVLKGAGDPEAGDDVGPRAGDVAVAQQDPAFRRLVEPGQHVEQGRLAGAVGTDERDDRMLGNLE